MASKNVRREKNYVIKTYLETARALEHAASVFENAKPQGAHYVALQTSTDALIKDAKALLTYAKELAKSDEVLELAWDGELDAQY